MSSQKLAHQTIPIGSDSTAPFVAFGDESHFHDTLVYAFAVLPRHDLPYVEKSITELKDYYGLPLDKPIHCRELFNPHRRKKLGLSHISHETCQKIIRRMVKIANWHSIWLRYSYCSLLQGTEHFSQFNGSLPMTNIHDNTVHYVPITTDPSNYPKAFLAYIMKGCFTPTKHRQEPPLSATKVIISQDSTKVTFIGGQKRQAHNLCAKFFDIDAPSGTVFRLDPVIENGQSFTMLEMADVFAYICSHAINNKNNTNSGSFFRNQLDSIRRWTRSEFVFASKVPGHH